MRKSRGTRPCASLFLAKHKDSFSVSEPLHRFMHNIHQGILPDVASPVNLLGRTILYFAIPQQLNHLLMCFPPPYRVRSRPSTQPESYTSNILEDLEPCGD